MDSLSARRSRSRRSGRTRPLRPAILTGALLALASACTTPAPARSVETPVGLVRAETTERAQHYAELLTRLHPAVRETLPGALDRPTELWIQDVLQRFRGEKHREDAMGFTIVTRDLEPGRIHLRDHTSYPEWYLAHELVHALMGPDWAELPGVLCEGLCDWIAAEVNEPYRSTIQTHRALHASLFFGGMSYDLLFTHPDTGEEQRTELWYAYATEPSEVDPEELIRLDRWSFHTQEDVPVSYYGLGFLIVSRIAERGGIERLFELCREAREQGFEVVPSRWILSAAGIENERSWASAARSLVGQREFREVFRTLPVIFQDLSVQAFGARWPHLAPNVFLERVNPRLHLSDGTLIPLADLHGVREELLLGDR